MSYISSFISYGLYNSAYKTNFKYSLDELCMFLIILKCFILFLVAYNFVSTRLLKIYSTTRDYLNVVPCHHPI